MKIIGKKRFPPMLKKQMIPLMKLKPRIGPGPRKPSEIELESVLTKQGWPTKSSELLKKVKKGLKK